MAIYGVDVASYQPVAFDLSGIDFVIVKATEGTGYVNPKYAGQLAHARAHGKVVGHYHFGHHGGVAEAIFFLKHLDLRPGEILAYDWEASGATQADRDAFLHYVKQHHPGVKVILYCNLDFWRNRDTESYAADGLWIADPNHPAGHPGVKHPWVFHQYASPNGMDRNVANFASVAALKAWAGWSVPKPPAPPVVHPPVKPPVPPVVHPPVPLTLEQRVSALEAAVKALEAKVH